MATDSKLIEMINKAIKEGRVGPNLQDQWEKALKVGGSVIDTVAKSIASILRF